MKRLKKGVGVVGSITIDKIVTEGQSFLKLGGVTTYAGLTYRRHGIPTLTVSNLAEQDLNIINKLKAERIDVFWQASVQTTHFVNYVFFAAYIVSRFSNHLSISAACRYAARIAALQVAGNYLTINQLGL